MADTKAGATPDDADGKTAGGAGQTQKPQNKRNKKRNSHFAADAAPKKGLTAAERELLMVDEDRFQIMNDRDSTKIGKYMIKEKNKLQNEEIKAQLENNLEMKRNMRAKMLDKNARKGNQLEAVKHSEDPNAKAMYKQSQKPGGMFKQDLGFDPFKDSISEEDDNTFQYQNEDAYKSAYLLKEHQAADAKAKAKLEKQRKKKGTPTPKQQKPDLGDNMDKLYGVEQSKIKKLLTKKTVERLQKQKQKAFFFDHENGTKKDNKLVGNAKFQKDQAEKKHLAKIKATPAVDFNFINDYSSSDYDCISEEEIEYMQKYQQDNLKNFQDLKKQISPDRKRGSRKQANQSQMGQDGGAAANRTGLKAQGVLNALKNSLRGQVKALLYEDSDDETGKPGNKTPRGGSQARQSNKGKEDSTHLQFQDLAGNTVGEGFRLSLHRQIEKSQLSKKTVIKQHNENFNSKLDAEQRIRNQLLNNILMDENRKFYDKRHIQKPQPYYNAPVDEYGNEFGEDTPKPDYRVREHRDIDDQGLFLCQRVFQSSNLNNNIVNCFDLDFGNPENTPANRYVVPDFTPGSYPQVEDLAENSEDECAIEDLRRQNYSRNSKQKSRNKIALNDVDMDHNTRHKPYKNKFEQQEKNINEIIKNEDTKLSDIQAQAEAAQARLNDQKTDPGTRSGYTGARSSAIDLSQRPSFNNFLVPDGSARKEDTELSQSRANTSQMSEAARSRVNKREVPQALQNNLMEFMADQKRDMEQNKQQYLSPDERQRIEKAKLQVKQHFLKFFRHHSVKKNKQFFLKWVSYVEFEKHRESEFEKVRKFLLKKNRYKKKLKGDKDKQESHILLNGFKSLNQNELKDNEDGGGQEMGISGLDATASSKIKEEADAFQNFQAVDPSRLLKKNKLFKNAFSLFKQELRKEGD